MKVFLYGYDVRNENLEPIDLLLSVLDETGISVCVYSKFKKAYEQHTGRVINYKTVSSHKELKTAKTDLVITLGGDGTILNAATVIRNLDLPILGINLGRMGFLASIEKKNIEAVIKRIVEGEYRTKQRTMLSLISEPDTFGDVSFALNDITLHKRDTSSMVTIHTFIDNEFLNSYWADGLIIATPTGSTGYSLSCGGPILLPDSKAFILTPIAPHNLNVRPMVIPDSCEVSLKIEGRADKFLCTLDSRSKIVTQDHSLIIRKCTFGLNLIHLEGFSFLNTIREKLTWGRDTRN